MCRPSPSPWLSVCALVLLAGCSERPTDPLAEAPEVALAIVEGDDQFGFPGDELPSPLVVEATVDGVPHPGVLVNFRAAQGEGSGWAGSALTGPDGRAQDYWTLGPDFGEHVVEARTVHSQTGEKFVWGSFTALAWDFTRLWTVTAPVNDQCLELMQLSTTSVGRVTPNGRPLLSLDRFKIRLGNVQFIGLNVELQPDHTFSTLGGSPDIAIEGVFNSPESLTFTLTVEVDPTDPCAPVFSSPITFTAG